MGRGLSELQRWMLVRAAERPDRPDGRKGGCDLTISRVLHEFYKIRMPPRWKGKRLAVSAKVFVGAAGLARKHRPAVLRAIQRLQERGLVEWTGGAKARWAGMDLTRAGKDFIGKQRGVQKGKRKRTTAK
jgi:hypothetical protein